ncbi:MAG: DUF4136 domain-containing protein [bacterium]
MRKLVLSAVILIMVIFSISCSTVRVSVNYDDTVNFNRYEAYSLVKAPRNKENRKGTVRNPLLKKEILNQIKTIFSEKGYTEAESKENADFLVIFYTNVQNKKDWVPPTYHTGRWGRIHRVRPGHTIHYKEGTLIIDIVDQEQKELVWQGVGKDVLNRVNPEENFVSSVREILKDFPPSE